jgi:hypothetical protein
LLKGVAHYGITYLKGSITMIKLITVITKWTMETLSTLRLLLTVLLKKNLEIFTLDGEEIMSVFKPTPEQKVKLYEIATLMKQDGLPDNFIANAVEIGLYYEGVFDLFELWAEEEEQNEKDQIISDLKEEINEFKEQPKEPVKKPYIKYTDLDLKLI